MNRRGFLKTLVVTPVVVTPVVPLLNIDEEPNRPEVKEKNVHVVTIIKNENIDVSKSLCTMITDSHYTGKRLPRSGSSPGVKQR